MSVTRCHNTIVDQVIWYYIQILDQVWGQTTIADAGRAWTILQQNKVLKNMTAVDQLTGVKWHDMPWEAVYGKFTTPKHYSSQDTPLLQNSPLVGLTQHSTAPSPACNTANSLQHYTQPATLYTACKTIHSLQDYTAPSPACNTVHSLQHCTENIAYGLGWKINSMSNTQAYS